MNKMNKMNKKQKEMIKQCRYYHGEEECDLLIPDRNMRLFWEYEKEWVRLGRDTVNPEETELGYFYHCGGKKRPGIPESLLDVMVHYYCKGYMSMSDAVAEFDKFIDEYLFVANDHYPEDKIPNN